MNKITLYRVVISEVDRKIDINRYRQHGQTYGSLIAVIKNNSTADTTLKYRYYSLSHISEMKINKRAQ